jgi:transcriptional regulator with XRE-family HTH domain
VPESYAARIAEAIAASRRARGWSQERLAAESGVPQTVVSSIERAVHRTPPLDTVQRLCRALDAELIVEIRPARLVGLADQRDPAHSACSGVARRLLERAGWLVASEVEFVTGRAHGFIDLLAYDPVRRRLLVIEVKTELRDVGALERQLGWYLREARGAAARLGWHPVVVAGLVVVLATAAVDAVVLANRDALKAAFPVRGRAVRATLDRKADLGGRGLVMLDPLRRGHAGLLRLAADGRRTAAPYRDYAQFAAAHGRRARPTRSSSSRGPAGIRASHAHG